MRNAAMKICFSFDHVFPARERAGRHIETLVRSFRDRGHDVSVITTQVDDSIDEDGVVALRLREAPGARGQARRDALITKAIGKFLKEQEVEVLFAEGLTPLSAVALKAARKGGVNAILRVLADASGIVSSIGGDRKLTPSALKKRVSTMLGYADVAAASSAWCAELVSEQFEGPVRVIPKCVDLSLFDPKRVKDGDRAGFRDRFDLEGKVALLYAREEIRAETVLASVPLMRAVAAAHPEAVLVVAGAVDDEEALRAGLEDAGLAASYRIIGSPSQRELATAYSAAALYVAPPDSRASESELLEAMAMGCAVAVTSSRAASIAPLVEEGGILVLDEDLEGSGAGAILALLDDADSLQEQRRRARASAAKRDIGSAVNAVEDLCHESLGLDAAPPSRDETNDEEGDDVAKKDPRDERDDFDDESDERSEARDEARDDDELETEEEDADDADDDEDDADEEDSHDDDSDDDDDDDDSDDESEDEDEDDDEDEDSDDDDEPSAAEERLGRGHELDDDADDDADEADSGRGASRGGDAEAEGDGEGDEESRGRGRRRRRRRRRTRAEEEAEARSDDGEDESGADGDAEAEDDEEAGEEGPKRGRKSAPGPDEIAAASRRLRELDPRLTLRDLMPFLRPPKDVFIFSLAAGSGHHRSGDAILESFKSVDQNLRVRLLDLSEFLARGVGAEDLRARLSELERRESSFAIAPAAPAAASEGETEEAAPAPATSSVEEELGRLLDGRLQTLVTEKRPHQVVLTHYLPVQSLAKLKREKGLRMRITAVVTHQDLLPYWLADGVDQYLVSNEKVRFKLLRAGVPASAVEVVGVPVLGRFEEDHDRESARRHFGGRSGVPTVLYRPAGEDGAAVLKTVERIVGLGANFNLVVLTGGREDLAKDVRALKAPRQVTLSALSRVDDIRDLLSAADLLVTRPSSHTAAEALAAGTPLLIVEPAEGLESRSADWFVDRGVAAVARDAADLEWLLTELLRQQGQRLRRLRDRATEHARSRGAAGACVEKICRALN
ncbi:MAG: glycosyltransferase [Planctomycetota bacterium]